MTVSPASLTFTTSNWATKQTVTLTGVDDDIDNANDRRNITLSHGVNGGNYSSVTVADKTIAIIDDDEPEVWFESIPSSLSENGGTDTYKVRLSLRPTATVTVSPSSSDTDAMTVSPASLTFTTSNWATKQTVTLTGVDDNVDNASDRRNTTLSHGVNGGNYSGVTVADRTIAITDDDDVPTLSLTLSPSSISENGGVSTVTARLSGASSADTEVTVSASAVSPADSSNFTLSSNDELTIAAGATVSTGTVTITGVDDVVVGPDKRVTVSGDASGGNGVSDPSDVTLTITDDDTPVITIAADADTVAEGETITFTLSVAPAPTQALSVNVSVGEGTIFLTSSVTIAADSSSAQFTRATYDDSVDEPDAAVSATIVYGTGYTVGTPNTAYVVVTDNDDPPELSISRSSTAEGDSGTKPLVFTVTLSGSATVDTVSLSYGTQNSTATAGSDYVSKSGTLKFIPGVSGTRTKTISVTIIGDQVQEQDELFTVRLSNVTTNAKVVKGLGIGKIDNDDGLQQVVPQITIAAATDTVVEGSSITFTLSAIPAPAESISVNVSVSGGTSFLSGSPPSSVTIAAGTRSASFSLATEDDAEDEPDATVTATIQTGTGYAVGTTSSAQVLVADNDVSGGPTLRLVLTPSSISENGGVSTVTAVLIGAKSAKTEVTVSASAVSPAESGDFTLSGTNLTIAAGATASTGEVTITGVDDSVVEPDRQVTVSGAATGGNGVADPPDVTLTITNDDDPVITITAAADSVAEGSPVPFTLWAYPAPVEALTVNVSVSGGSSFLEGTPPTSVTIAANSSEAAFNLPTEDDAEDEPDATVTVTIVNGTGYTVATADSAVVVVTDDDAAPRALSPPGNVTVTPGDSQLTLDWTATPNATGYQVKHRVVKGVSNPDTWSWTDVGNVTSHTIRGLVNGTTYRVRLRAVNATDASKAAIEIGTPTAGSDPVITIAAAADTVAEGTTINFTLSASPAPAETLTVIMSVSGGTSFRSGTAPTSVTIAAGTSSAQFSLATEDDAVDEPDATVTATIVNGTGYAAGTAYKAEVVVTDDDVPGVLSPPGNVTVTPGNGQLTLDWTASPNATGYQVKHRVKGVSKPDPWTWTAVSNVTSHTISNLVNGSTYILRLRAVSASNTSSVVIEEGKPSAGSSPVITIAAAADTVSEGSSVSFTVTASSAPVTDLEVSVSVTGGTGFLSGTPPGSVTIAASSSSAQLSLATTDDPVDEADATVTATIQDDTGYDVGSSNSAQVVVTDNDAAPSGITLSVSPAVASEGDSVSVTVTATPSGGTLFGTEQTVGVTVSGSGTSNAVGFDSVSDFDVVIGAGASNGNGTFALVSTDNSDDNIDETITLSGTASPSGVPVTPATITLSDDDDPVITIAAAADTVAEGTSVSFTVTASSAPVTELSVKVSVSGGTGFLSGTPPTSVTIAANSTNAQFSLATADDPVDEADATVTVTIGTGTGYAVGASNSAQVVVTDNDAAPTGISLSVSPASASEADSAKVVTVTATPSGGTLFGTEQTVSVSVSGSGASNAVSFSSVSDFNVTIGAGSSSGDGTFTLVPVDNQAINVANSITVSGTASPSGVTVTSATIVLTDDDVPQVTIAAAADTVAEGTSITFTLSASPEPADTLSVNVSVSGGASFRSGTAPTSVTIAAGSSSAQFSLATTDDTVDEPDATVTARVGTGTGYEKGNPHSAQVLVTDDDDAPGTLSPPGNVTVTPGDGQLTLSWTASPNATGYQVKHREKGVNIPNPWPWTDAGNVTSHTIGSLINGTTYILRLRAVNATDTSSVAREEGTPSATSARAVVASPPAVAHPLEDITLEEGDSRSMDVAATFTGPGLAYGASVSDAAVAAAAVTGGTMTVAGLAQGSTTLSVTAVNESGTAGYSITVTVKPSSAERDAYEAVLAAMGRGLMSSARATMEDRFALVAEERRLAVAGRRVDGLASGVTALIGLTGYHIPRNWNDPTQPRAPGRSGRVDVLRNSSFVYTLPRYGQEGYTNRVTLWGTGNVQAFRASPDNWRYGGGLRTAYLGVDVSVPGLIAGVSLSRTSGAASIDVPGAQGQVQTRLTGVYPYARWQSSSRPLQVWSILGEGRGSAVTEGENRDLSMRMAMLGLRTRFMYLSGVSFSVVGHAGVMSLNASSPAASIQGDLNADIRQVRLGLEGSSGTVRMGPSSLTPFAQVAGRYDGGKGETGGGVEIAGGFRLTGGRLGLEARGRLLAAHSASGYQERGLSFIAYVRPNTAGGLSMSIAPRWGADTRNVDMTWREDGGISSGRRSAGHTGAVRAQIGYSMLNSALRGVSLTPFAETDISGADRRSMRLGTRLGAKEGKLSVEFAGERRQDPIRSADHRVGFLGRYRF